MEKSTNQNLFRKENKILSISDNYIYEKSIYIIQNNMSYLIDSKILESSRFLEDSISFKEINDIKSKTFLNLISAPLNWLNSNGFTVYDYKDDKKIRKKK